MLSCTVSSRSIASSRVTGFGLDADLMMPLQVAEEEIASR
jgi:hypothetical protein